MHEISVLQQNPESPLHSVATFEDLNLSDELKKGLYLSGYTRPSKIQAHALPLLLRNPPEHLIAQAQTGTGKTATFCLALLSRLDYTDPSTQAIVVAPSRELARQIFDVMKTLARFTAATITQIVPHVVRTSDKITGHIIIGTPGKLGDMIKRTMTLAQRSRVKMLVLDEADLMLDLQGLGNQSLQIKKLLPDSIQLIFFSATWDDTVDKFAHRFITGLSNQIRLETYQLTLEYVKQFFIDCDSEDDRFQVLVGLYGIMTISQSIIFKRAMAEKISTKMILNHHQVSFLHGGLEPEERDDVMDEFRSGRTKVLVTTNVLARGIDVERVNMVINYDLPLDNDGKPDPNTYLHRIGRTGRFGRLGVSVNFVHDHSSQEVLAEFQNHFDREILRVPTELDEADGVMVADQESARLERIEAFFKKAMKL
ncbi:RNA helicase required for poly(A+) mRNA export [Dissophora globulifera]|nr:RNA helicase required for poly(A+) mRNA export [Dissophora globulifera]